MRDAFLNKLTKLAEADKDIVLLTADLGFGVFEKFEDGLFVISKIPPWKFCNFKISKCNF